jgi:hypothetical protein
MAIIPINNLVLYPALGAWASKRPHLRRMGTVIVFAAWRGSRRRAAA